VRIRDLFAGPAGWDEGAASLGLHDILGIEWDPDACATAEAAGHARAGRTVTVRTGKRDKRVREGADVALLDPYETCGPDLDGLIASPPCQGFSMAGKGLGRRDSARIIRAVGDLAAGRDCLPELRGHIKDPRSALALEPLRWALAVEPDWTCWEQVPAVLPLWEACAEALRADGYSVWTGDVQAEQYGVPQTRKRAVLIASRYRQVGRPVPTHSRYHSRTPDKLDPGVQKWVSIADALPYVSGYFRTDDQDRASARPVANAPAATIKGGNGGGSCLEVGFVKEPGHRVSASSAARKGGPQGRRATIREVGLLQAFPADYPWQGSKTAQYRQVGDAVPPLLAAHVLAEATGYALP